MKPQNSKVRPRVLFFDHVATVSGGEVALLNLVRHFDLSVIEPIVVLGEEGILADRLRDVVEVHILPMRADVRQARKDDLGGRKALSLMAVTEAGRYVLQLARFMRKHRIDLLQTNSLKSDLLGASAAKISGTPVVWYVRDRITDDYLPAKVVRAFRWTSRWMPDLIIADSHAVAATLSDATSKPIHVVHEGTPHEEFAGPGLPDSGRKVDTTAVVGLVGRISFWKGQDIFIQAASLLVHKYPKVQFRIIGAALFGESEFEAKLHKLAQQLHLGDSLLFAGFRHDIHQAIAELDVLVHASTRPEPFGQVIIEGMAAGKPIVATNAGGVPEIVEDGVTGYLVPMSDPDGIATAIDRLLADPEAARQMGIRAQAHVVKNFSISKTVDGVMNAYQALISFPSQFK